MTADRSTSQRQVREFVKSKRRARIVFLFAVILFIFGGYLLLPDTVHGVASNNYAWTQQNTGLSGGNMVGLVIDPDTSSTLYILTKGSGVYKTTDSGDNWTAVNTGLPSNKNVGWGHLYGELLTMDPNDADILYAAFEGVVYKTTNGGTSWTESNTGIEICAPNYQIAGVVIDPTDSTHLFAGHVASGCGGGIFESTDSGANWSRVPDTGIGNDVWMLAINPTDITKMYSATQYIGFSYSHNSGLTWTNNKPSGGSGHGVYVGTHPITTSRVFYGNSLALYVSEDDGLNWTSHIADVAGGVIDVDFFDDDQTIGFAVGNGGLFKTVDSGTSWSEIGSHDSKFLKTIEIDSTSSTTLYIGSSATGMYKSTDGGTTLSAINTGIPISLTINTLEIAPSDTSRYYLDASGLGFYKSTDSGYTWELQDSSTLALDISIDPLDEDTVFAAYADIHKTTDGGATWSTVFSSSTAQAFPVISVDPANGDHVLTYDSTNKYLYRTLDGGDTWDVVDGFTTSATAIYNIVFDPTDSDKVYAGTYDAFWKSTDNGATWTQITTGLPGGASGWIDGTAIDPTNVTTLYVGLRSLQVYKSTDSGNTWSNTSYSAPGEVTTNRVIVDSNGAVHAFTSDGWQKSTDGGDTWTDQTFVDANIGFFRGPGQVDPVDVTRFIGSGTTEGLFVFENYIPLFETSTISVADDNGDAIQVGDTLTYTIDVTNSGPAVGTNTTFSFPLSEAHLSFVSGSAEINNAATSDFTSGGVVTLDLDDLLMGDSVILGFQAQVLVEFEDTHSLSITSDEDTTGTSADTLTISVNETPTITSGGKSKRESVANKESEVSDEKQSPSPISKDKNMIIHLFLQDLRLGLTDMDVLRLQEFLNTYGSPVSSTGVGAPGQETDYFGLLTQSALANFQKENNIEPPVGYFGPLTRAAINNLLDTEIKTDIAVEQNVSIPQNDLEIESTGSSVVWLQNFLITKNVGASATALSNVGATGYFGILTQSALAEYQVSSGINPAVGYYGPITRSYINDNE